MDRMRIGTFKKALIVYLSLLATSAAALMFPGSNLNAQVPIGPDSEGRVVGVIIHTAKPYNRVIDAIGDMGGVVTFQYENVDAIAAQVPGGSLGLLHRHPLVTGVEKDVIVELPPIPGENLELEGRLIRPAQGFESTGLSLKPGELPDRFPSYITRGNRGGRSLAGNRSRGRGYRRSNRQRDGCKPRCVCPVAGDVESPEGRVIAGPDLSTDAGTRFEGSTKPTNGNHGTFVAGMIASNCFMASRQKGTSRR